jgi:epoxyqueuosine reductase QueG
MNWRKDQLCIDACPGDAFYDQPIPNDNGIVTHIDQEKCFSFFAENYGCAVCITVCLFCRIDYES